MGKKCAVTRDTFPPSPLQATALMPKIYTRRNGSQMAFVLQSVNAAVHPLQSPASLPVTHGKWGRQVLKSFHAFRGHEFQVHLLLSPFFCSAVAPVQCCKISFVECRAPLDPPNLKFNFSSWLLHAVGANFLPSTWQVCCAWSVARGCFLCPAVQWQQCSRCRGNGAALPSPLRGDTQQEHSCCHCAGVRGFGTDLSCSRIRVPLNLFAGLTQVLACPPFPAH